MHKISKEEILEYLRRLSAATGKDYSAVVRLIEDSIEKGFNFYKIKLINHIEPQFDCEVYEHIKSLFNSKMKAFQKFGLIYAVKNFSHVISEDSYKESAWYILAKDMQVKDLQHKKVYQSLDGVFYTVGTFVNEYGLKWVTITKPCLLQG